MKASFYVELKGRSVFWAVSLIFIITGSIFAFAVPAIISRSEKKSLHATANVISVTQNKGMYYTTVEFKTDDGEIIRTESSTSSNFRRDAGTKVRISYSKNAPHDVSFTDDLDMIKYVFRTIGLIFFFIGSSVFLLMIASIYIRIKSPENENVFLWWINFAGGMTGALVFAVPSALVYPIFKLLPENIQKQAQNTSILLPLFTALGLLVCTGIFFLARRQLRSRPRWK